MVAVKTKLSNCARDQFLRNDEKYHSFIVLGLDNLYGTSTSNNVPLSDVIEEQYTNFVFEDDKEYKGIPTGQSYIDEDGDIIDYQVITKDDHPGRLKYFISKDNILISSLRLAKAPALMFGDDNIKLEEYVFSNGYYVLSVKPGWNLKFVLYLLRSKRIKQILDNSIYRGIGISAYRIDDLLKCKISNVSNSSQDNAVKKIIPIEKKIQKLKETLVPSQEIINKSFEDFFSFDRKILFQIDCCKSGNYKFSSISEDNTNLRESYRWNKAIEIQKALISEVKCCKKLGHYIISTQNGWSPNCDENQSSYQVLGIDAIKYDGMVSFDNVKYSDETKDNIESFVVNDNDYFVTRGNTTDLVALASVAHVKEDDPTTIFPDLIIRVGFTEDICKEYMAYVFNSFIGRLYFKYSTKGKNQTMVKVSPRELKDFYAPIPSFKDQQYLVEKIHAEIAKQDSIKVEIAKLRSQIDKIIESAM